MSLPDGVTTCLLTYGPITDTFGNLADSIEVEVVADRTVVHAASGRTMFKNPVTVTAEGGGVAQIAVPHTDQAGFRDQQQNSLTGWYYTITLTARFSNGPQSDKKVAQFVIGQTTVDADLLPSSGMVTPGVTAPTTGVTSVLGFTGAITEADLAGTFVPRWKASTAVLAGALAVAPTGQTIQRIANGTTGTTYDTAEAALWTIVTGAPTSTISSPPVLARMDIVTANRSEIVSKEDYLTCTYTVSGVPGQADLYGTGRIRGRGNNTWTLAKKPFKFKPDTKVALLGMPANDDWALLANFGDLAMMNTALAFTIGASMEGLDWTPRSGFVRLYLNGVFQGFYQLTESAKFGADRINRTKASGTTGLAATGAFLLEVDQRLEENDEVGFRTTENVPVIFDDPDGTVSQHFTHVQTRVQAFEDALFGSGFADPTTGYRAYIDVDSFIDWYLVQELAKNFEGIFGSSCKFYLTRDATGVPGKFFMGPLWDFDRSFGDTQLGTPFGPTGYYIKTGGAVWIERMFDDSWFAAQVATRWQALATRLTTTGPLKVETLVDSIAARIAAPSIEDQTKWSYSSDITVAAAAKKAWLESRIAWLTLVFTPPTQTPTQAPTGLAAISLSATGATLTWNPVTGPGGAEEYLVQYRTGAGSFTTLTGVDSDNRLAALSALSQDTLYEAKVAAVNDFGTGPFATVTFTTPTSITLGDPVVADNFNRADSGTLGVTSTGAKTWTTDAGWSLVDGKAVYDGSAGNGRAWIDAGALGDADYEVRFTPTYVTSMDYPFGAVVRGHGPGEFNGEGYVNHAVRTDTPWIYSSDASTIVPLPGARAHVSGEPVRMQVVGDTITVLYGDTPVVELTNASADVGTSRIGMLGVEGRAAAFEDFGVRPIL